MKWATFHHPDLCVPVIGRAVGLEILELTATLGRFAATRGRSLRWGAGYPNRQAYYAAQHRLRKAGLIVDRGGHRGSTFLALTPEGRARLPDVLHPRRFWNRKWNGIWYVLVYDVPEAERAYRDVLRKFLRRMRMGCLQNSVWVTWRDIRPRYADLVEAARVDSYSYLFEARTVLGRSSHDVVRDAWDTDALAASQQWYCSVCEDNLGRLKDGAVSSSEGLSLAREELAAYAAVMSRDPLLPRPLWPRNYLGERAYSLHRKIHRELGCRL